MPGYGELLGRAYGSLAQAARSCGDCGWELAKRTWAENAHLGWPEVLLCGLCALGWTALRRLCCRRLFGVSAGGITGNAGGFGRGERKGHSTPCLRAWAWGGVLGDPSASVLRLDLHP